jgi:hypothetical protein
MPLLTVVNKVGKCNTVKVNNPITSLERSGGFQEFDARNFFLRQSEHEGGKFVSSRHQPPVPQHLLLVLISVTV